MLGVGVGCLSQRPLGAPPHSLQIPTPGSHQTRLSIPPLLPQAVQAFLYRRALTSQGNDLPSTVCPEPTLCFLPQWKWNCLSR